MSSDLFQSLGLKDVNPGACTGSWIDTKGEAFVSFNPTNGEPMRGRFATRADYETVVTAASDAFATWRMMPAPQRGEIVRQLGEELREHKEPLGRLVSLEMGKILSEGLGEVQEMIDICDFAVGLSRQLYGLTMHSERPQHRMYEQWHPLGPIGIITAFNFPVAVWAWNAALAAVCGDTMIWKPSEKTPLTAIAVQNIANRVMERNGLERHLQPGRRPRSQEVGERDARRPPPAADLGHRLLPHGPPRRRRSSASGSAARLLELGGNNARDRDGRRRPGPGPARRALRRRRHGRPALHLDAPPDPAEGHRRRSSPSKLVKAYGTGPHRRSARTRTR